MCSEKLPGDGAWAHRTRRNDSSRSNLAPTRRVLRDVERERARQDEKWGEQNPPDGTNVNYALNAALEKHFTEAAFAAGRGTWRHILLEEVYEALAETDHALLREELVQVAAVAVAWVEAIDRRPS